MEELRPFRRCRRGTPRSTGRRVGIAALPAVRERITAENADAAGGSVQVRYVAVYAQCMTAKGNPIGGPSVAEPVYVYPHPYYWGPEYY
jgi:hypothetical protein